MLRDLTIQNYRAFKDFTIDGLARVNLIVGANNSGKTSFLEAVYLLVNQDNPFSLQELLEYRGEYTQVPTPALYARDFRDSYRYQLAHVFTDHEPMPAPDRPQARNMIQLRSDKDNSLSLALWVESRGEPSQETPYLLRLDYSFEHELSPILSHRYSTTTQCKVDSQRLQSIH